MQCRMSSVNLREKQLATGLVLQQHAQPVIFDTELGSARKWHMQSWTYAGKQKHFAEQLMEQYAVGRGTIVPCRKRRTMDGD